MRLTKLFSGLFLSLLLVLTVVCSPAQVPPQQKNAVRKAISEYIQRDQKLKGDFLIKDDEKGTVQVLNFDHVHDGVDQIEDGKYLACVDFKQGETVLDLDFSVKANPSGELEVSDIVIHKIDGRDVTQE